MRMTPKHSTFQIGSNFIFRYYFLSCSAYLVLTLYIACHAVYHMLTTENHIRCGWHNTTFIMKFPDECNREYCAKKPVRVCKSNTNKKA
jgi:hypothetical protein